MTTLQETFHLLETKDVQQLPEVASIRRAFQKKHELEKQIVQLIKDYERDSGLAIDMIKYQRDITLPIRGPRYTSLSIIITSDDE
jgi:hypothetical protein